MEPENISAAETTKVPKAQMALFFRFGAHPAPLFA
ncbi:unnamed protein product [Penicillium roqueforti FM164]|uniref:Genomic scaffold, ProqFM164S04 n=1 Tax=Penicillium roqueforti (strain FM164) TaxID=1365484 RepID=W6QHH3_PENRF|nr:unnamed protein product [Penicillium roqueforti FM164]